MFKKYFTLSLKQKRENTGFIFILPWMIGFLLFFSYPLYESLKFSFYKLIITPDGYTLDFIGLKNFKDALLVHSSYNRDLTESIMNMVFNVPMILFFSLFAAVLLNQAFRGRTLARAIFFLPVIIATGAISSADVSNALNSMVAGAAEAGGAFESVGFLRSFELQRMLLRLGVDPVLVGYLTGAVDRIFEIVSSSGVQILIFLAGLQAIPKSMYEAAKMEGATGYESFWKITFPMLSPLILTNIIYTIIDSFSNNPLTELLLSTAFSQLNFGLSAAMAWMYTLIISIILIITGYLVSKRVFYYN
jgi:ABC-type sugar transport system permease subunit